MPNTHYTNLHAQYLKAMGIQVWVRRNLPSALPEEPAPVNEPAISSEPTQVVSDKTPPAIAESPVPSPMMATSPPAVAQVSTPTTPKPPLPDTSQISEPPENSSVPELNWDTLQSQVATCTNCELHKTRTNTVFGVGDQQADLILIGEAPGADEDAQAEPFVGKAGKLLNAMLYAIDFKREDVYIANVIKCRPPNNRNPHAQELACCNEFLRHQIALIKPKLIVAVGRISAQYLLATQTPIGKLRGQRFEYGETKIPLIATYHPAYLLRRPTEKRQSWLDLQFISKTMSEL